MLLNRNVLQITEQLMAVLFMRSVSVSSIKADRKLGA